MTELSEKPLKVNYSKAMKNRELSWLQFNERVLEEANCAETPLFERYFFLSIFTTNLDEFFMVRVGSLIDYMNHSPDYMDNKTGMNAKEQLRKIYDTVAGLYKSRDISFREIEAELAYEGIKRFLPSDLDKSEKKELDNFFYYRLSPVLAPQIVDVSHPFPHIENKRLIITVFLNTKNKNIFGMIPMPRDIERVYFIDEKKNKFILMEDIILHYCDKIFDNYSILEKTVISVTRNADINTIDEMIDDDEDFRQHISKLLKERRRLAPVRLEVQNRHCEKIISFLRKKLSLSNEQTLHSIAPLDLRYCTILKENTSPHICQKLSFERFEPAVSSVFNEKDSLIKQVRQRDILLSHPFESINPFLAIIKEAANSKHVSGIKITLYRLAEQSKLVEYLILAAENGKDVFVFIELRARMDEENNIYWAKRMEDAGCHVFYGLWDFKIHSKVCLIILNDFGKHEYITHIGTGNYNEKTSLLYTDLSLITSNAGIGKDAAVFFKNIMVGNLEDHYTYLWVAPESFKSNLIKCISKEMERGKEGHITIKCNSLTDKDVIVSLINASISGVQIELIIRGICCLIPQIQGLTETIVVKSIVGRFLEHSRIYRFGKGKDTVIYIGSGDMMTRNTERRVEVFTPVFSKEIKDKLSSMLDIILKDNVKAREQTSTGEYIYSYSSGPPLNSQLHFIEQFNIPDDINTIKQKRRLGVKGLKKIFG